MSCGDQDQQVYDAESSPEQSISAEALESSSNTSTETGGFIELHQEDETEEGERVGDLSEGGEDEEDREDLELLAELRELYKGINSSLYANTSSESLNSTASDDPERLRRKVQQLQVNVAEWKQSYDLLMQELRKMKLERVVEKEELVKTVKGLNTDAKDFEQTIRRLEFDLSEHMKLLNRADAMNKYLLKEVNELRKERGMREVELNSLSVQVDGLRDKQQDQIRADLSHVIQLIDSGVKEGVLKLSELKLLSQSVPFPREDLPLGCSCGPLLDRYKAELESVREELKKRAIEMGVVRAELSSLQGEHQETVEELVETCTQLQDLMQDKTTLQAELCEERQQKNLLKEEVKDLEEQLRSSGYKEQSLNDSLSSANDSLRHVQDLTQQRVDLKDQELNHVKAELEDVEQRHKMLEQKMAESRLHIEQLERAERTAQLEGEELREELEEWKAKEWHIEEMAGEKDTLQRKIHGMTAELDSQVKLAEQYKANLSTVQELHCNSQEEAGRLRGQLLAKETQLSRMLTTLQLTSSQISALRRRGQGRSPKSRSKSRSNSPKAITLELAECESAVEELEQELRAHGQQWEALHEASIREAAAVNQLTARKDQLEEELAEQRETVRHLEGLLQEVGASHERMQGVVEACEGRVQALADELESTRSKYKDACEEVLALKEELSSLGSIQDQQQLLILELGKREEQIGHLQDREKGMTLEYQSCVEGVALAESARAVLEEELAHVQETLCAQEEQVEQLERGVAEEKRLRLEEVERLDQKLQEEKTCHDDDMSACAQVISDLEKELQAKANGVEEERAQYLELEQLLQDKVKAIQKLENEKQFLDQQYGHTMSEVEHSQQLVESLQEDLASSQGRCDGLQQMMKEYEHQFQDMAEHLHINLQDKLTLQDKVAMVTREVLGLQGELEVSASHHTLLRQEEEGRVSGLRDQLAACEQELAQLLQERNRLNVSYEQEKVEREGLTFDLETVQHDLTCKVSQYEKAIEGLKTQISRMEDSQRRLEQEKAALSANVSSATNRQAFVEGQLAEAKDQLIQQEQTQGVLEMAATDRLSTIQRLTKELEELRLGVGLEMRSEVNELETKLREKQEEITGAQLRVMKAEKSHADILQQLAHLEQCLVEAATREKEEVDAQDLICEREEQLRRVREELDQVLESHEAKEQHWEDELFRLSAQLELSQQKLLQFEKDLAVNEEEQDSLEAKLRSSQRMEDIAKQEALSSQQFEETLKRQLEEKRAQVVEFEKSLAEQRGRVATLQGKLAASEEGRARLQRRVSELDEESNSLLHRHLETEQELKATEYTLDERTDQNKQLQEDCKSLAEKMSTVSQGERSSNDSLVQRIRDMDSQLASLKAAHNDLELRNDMLMQANAELKAQMSSMSVASGDELPVASASTHSINGGALSLNVNVDITNLPTTTTTITTGTSTVGVASASVPIHFDSQYRRTLEHGLHPPLMEESHFPGSETESEAALDKEYWVNRAGELSVQLQQSSEYWAQKVRELSIDLETKKQGPRHVD